MEKKFRLLLLLALLLTAATGAWAQEQSETITTATYGQLTYTGEHFTITGDYADGDGLWIGNAGGSDKTVTIESKNGENITKIVAVLGYVQGWVDTKLATTSGEVTGTYELGQTITISSVNATTVTLSSPDSDFKLIEFNSWIIYYGDAPAGFTVSMKSGVKDADKWTVKVGEGQAQALPIGGLNEGDAVTLQYNGRLKVKGMKATSDAAPAGNIVDLSTLTENTELQDGDVLTGTLGANVKISIADGATVTLDGATINGVDDANYDWAGITCLGDATIILSGTNTVKGFKGDYPGIQAAAGKTLIINGTGSLTASTYGWSAGIGGGKGVACGNIEIQDGTITATGGQYGAGIGGGNNASCGNITISGGTVTATGGERGAGIGGGRRALDDVSCGNILISGGTVTATGGESAAGIGGGRGNNNKYLSNCGTITITTGVTKVTATKGEYAPNSIGAGEYGTCGTVTIGGNVGAITTSPYTYPAAD